MAIVHQIAERHGGTVSVDSAGKGQGATFTVLLPLSIAAESANGNSASSKRCDADAQIDRNHSKIASLQSTKQN